MQLEYSEYINLVEGGMMKSVTYHYVMIKVVPGVSAIMSHIQNWAGCLV